jgi:hypothetical protein
MTTLSSLVTLPRLALLLIPSLTVACAPDDPGVFGDGSEGGEGGGSLFDSAYGDDEDGTDSDSDGSNDVGGGSSSGSGAGASGSGTSSGTGGSTGTGASTGTGGSTGTGTSTGTGGVDPLACCLPAESPGCGDPTVQACVCGLDTYCCSTAWDAQCVETAMLFCYSCAG